MDHNYFVLDKQITNSYQQNTGSHVSEEEPNSYHKVDDGIEETYHDIDIDGEEPYNTIDDTNPMTTANKGSENVYNRVGAEAADYDHIGSKAAAQRDIGGHEDYDTTNLVQSRNTKQTEVSDLYNHINAGHDTDVDGDYSSTKPEKPCVDDSDYSKLNWFAGAWWNNWGDRI